MNKRSVILVSLQCLGAGYVSMIFQSLSYFICFQVTAAHNGAQPYGIDMLLSHVLIAPFLQYTFWQGDGVPSMYLVIIFGFLSFGFGRRFPWYLPAAIVGVCAVISIINWDLRINDVLSYSFNAKLISRITAIIGTIVIGVMSNKWVRRSAIDLHLGDNS